jgi:hypothetical protein
MGDYRPGWLRTTPDEFQQSFMEEHALKWKEAVIS